MYTYLLDLLYNYLYINFMYSIHITYFIIHYTLTN